MANKDYDELLEAFMNNSQKAYNEDRERHEKSSQNLPSSYNTFSKEKNKEKKKETAKANKSPKKKRNIGTAGKVLLGFVLVCCVVAVVCMSVVLVYSYSFIHGDPVFDLNEEATGQNQTSIIYCYDSKDNLVELTRLHGEENRIWLENSEMTEYLSKAFIAIEDVRFQKHHGVDWIRTVGVMVKPSNSGQGGSTITQQLIKNLTDDNDVTFVRKFNEILSALNIEKHYDKEEIMEAYLNTIYLSHGCYGVKTAAETYFGKDVKDLNIAECACLAAITKYPTKYDPLLNPENNEARKNFILKNMLNEGFITQEQYDEAIAYKMIYTNSKEYKGSKVTKSKTAQSQNKTVNSYHTDYLIDQVIADLQKNGYSAKKARKLIFGGGLKIYSAVDLDVQNAMEDVYENYRKMPDETVQGACVVMDYKGRILGMIGGTGKKKQDRVLNRAWQSKRQPGSTIKPLSVYGPALEKSLNDDDVNIYWSTPTPDKPLTKIDGKPWPTNEGGGYSGGNLTVQKGLANSKNTISAQTLDKIGVNYSYDFLINRFHISTLETLDCDYAPMATGSMTHGVSVLEMTTAYQAFGNGGYYYEGYSYYKIEDSKGNVIIEKTPDTTKETALSTNTAWLMNKLLQTVMTEGTGTSYKISGVQCFGKTGTTTGSYDRWFIGGTPEYVGGVWYGYDKNKEVVYRLSYNPAGTLWNEVMKRIYEAKGKNVTKFPECEGLVHREYAANGKLCKGSGRWGWFDVNNLPGTTTESGFTSSTEKSEDNSTTKNNSQTTSSNDDTTEPTEAQTQEPSAKPEETTAGGADGNDNTDDTD
ncbi:MAG: transglycosylase domain-containing protein [Eubacterium sp.]